MVRRHRDVLIVLVGSVAACGRTPELGADAAPASDAALAPRWQFETPAIELVPAEEGYYCSYHSIPADLGLIGRVGFYGLAGVHDLSLEVVPGPVADGAFDQICARSARAATLFSLERQLGDLVLPDDAPLLLGDGLAVVVRIHFLNPDDAPRRSYAIISWYEATVAASQTSGVFSATRTDFSVPPGASSIETACGLAAGTRLIGAYPISHGLGYRLAISDDSGTLVSTFDWAHPTRATWSTPYYPPAGMLRARCEYLNTTGQIVDGGERLLLDERCGMSALIIPGEGLSACSM